MAGHAYKTVHRRFWEKVSRGENGCWLWTGAKTVGGYGRFAPVSQDKNKVILAHRFAYKEIIGPLPSYYPGGPELDHVCRNRACCNPFHLDIVTGRENNWRGNSPASLCASKTHCVNGHPFSGTNLKWYAPESRRRCRECDRNTSRRFKNNHPEKVKEDSRRYKQENKEKIRQSNKLYKANKKAAMSLDGAST